MRILHVIRTLDPAWGGPVECVRQLCLQAQAHNHASEVVALDDQSASWLREWTVPVHALGAAGSTYGYSRALDRWLEANAEDYDAIVVHSIWMYFSWAVWKATRQRRVPYYLYIHGALDPWFKRYSLKNLKKSIYWKLFEHKVLRDAEAVLFTTDEEKALAAGAFHPYQCHAVTVGLSVAEPPEPRRGYEERWLAEMTSKWPALANRKLLLFLGRIHEKKAVDLLLRGFAAIRSQRPDIALMVAGPGEPGMIDSLRRLTRDLGAEDSVMWTGPLYGPAKWAALRSADAYVLPSHQENFGISVVEALACGTPVLISDKVNIWHQVHSEDAGLVATDDLEGVLKLLRNWLKLHPDRKQEMRENARACYTTHFSAQAGSTGLFRLLGDSELEDVEPVLSNVG